MISKYIVVVLSFVIAFTFSGCGGERTPSETFYVVDESLGQADPIVSNFVENSQSKNTSTNKVKKETLKIKTISITKNNMPYFKILGRALPSVGSGIYLNWSNSSVEFSVEAKGNIFLNLVAEIKGEIFIRVAIDGKALGVPILIDSSGDYQVANDLKQGRHTVKVVRITSAETGTLKLAKIKTTGSLVESQPKPKSLYIEALGDQTLLGEGTLLGDEFFKSASFSESKVSGKVYQDSTKTYTYLAAEKLGADTSTTTLKAISIGLSVRYVESENSGLTLDITNGTLPEIYKKANLFGTTEYTYQRKPNIIVVDCGRYDIDPTFQAAAQQKTGTPYNDTTVMTKTISFFKSLKGQNPGVKIIWCYGFAKKDSKFKEYMQIILNHLGGEENNFYFLELKTAGKGPNYFSPAEHQANAVLLANKIKAII